jgi:hypothetical protein
MIDLEVLALASGAKEISKYWDQLANPDAIDGYSLLVPEEVLPELRSAIEQSLRPASRAEIAKAQSPFSSSAARGTTAPLRTRKPTSC